MELLHDAVAAVAPTGVLFVIAVSGAAVSLGWQVGRWLSGLAGAQ